MPGNEALAEVFEANRPHLTAVAYRLLGSISDSDDAVQEAWIRASRAGRDGIENVGGWLTTIVARICLNMLQARKSRREESLDTHVPDPIVTTGDGAGPEQEAVLAESVGLALLVVLDELTPAERLAFVLHDVFAIRFDEVARIVGRSTEATRQLASRARRRVQRATPPADANLTTQREVVEAFLAAAREGDFERLVAVLDPEVVLRADAGRPGLSQTIRGARLVAAQASLFRGVTANLRVAFVNGAPGLVSWGKDGTPASVMSVVVTGGKISRIYILADRERLRRLSLDRVRVS